MNGRISRRIRKLMMIQFSVLDTYIKATKMSKTAKSERTEELSWTTIYRNIKKLYVRDNLHKEFFDILMKKEKI